MTNNELLIHLNYIELGRHNFNTDEDFDNARRMIEELKEMINGRLR